MANDAPLYITLSASEHQKLKVRAALMNRSISEILREAIRDINKQPMPALDEADQGRES